MNTEPAPFPPHVGHEFLLWLWRVSAVGGRLHLSDRVGAVDIWVDDRLVFRDQGESKPVVVLTGENPAAGETARTALLSGKALREIRIGMRRDDREYHATLDGELTIKGLDLPTAVSEDLESTLLDRKFLFEEFASVLRAAFEQYCSRRLDGSYRADLEAWLS